MKKNLKLFTYAFGAFLVGSLASCSDDISGNGGDGIVTDPTENATPLSTAKVTVNSANLSRVFNYTSNDSRVSRAVEDVMPDYPADIAATAQEITNSEWIRGNGNYKIVDGPKIQWGINIEGNNSPVNIFVESDYVGKINVNNPQSLNIYIAPGVTYSPGPGEWDQRITDCNIAKIFLYGTLNTKRLELLEKQEFYALGDVEITEQLYSSGSNPKIFVNGTLIVKSISVNSGFELSGCQVIVEKELISQSGTVKLNVRYLESPSIILTGDACEINLEDGGLLKADYLKFQGNPNPYNIVKGKTANIVIKTIEIQNANATNFASHFEGVVYNETANANNVHGQPMAHESQRGAFQPYNDGLSIEVPSCGSVEPDPVIPPHIELVTRVQNHDHNSDKPSLRHLSATAITYGNGRYYASYHMRGGNWANDSYDKGTDADTEGCIESWTMNDDVLTLSNWMWTDLIDFNHIYFDNQAATGKKVVTMGHHAKKGGIFGYVSENFADDANIGEENTLEFDAIKSSVRIESTTGALQDWANGGDVNSAYRASGSSNYLITTSRGYTTVDATTGKQTREASDVNKNGIPVLNIFNDDSVSVKHITPYNGGFAVLALDERKVATATASSTATVYFFDSEASVVAGTPYTKTQLSKGVVCPVDGKNVLFANGNELYACLGQGGLVRLNGTVEADSWQRPAVENDETSNGNVPVNGVYADNNYVYVANGNNLTILDKEFNEVANYQVPDNEDGRSYSANYVLVNDGLIFVAYGQDGIRVLRLVE